MLKNPAAVALGTLGGRSTSEAKKAAARLNGKRGGHPKGRPRKPVNNSLEPTEPVLESE